MKEAFEGQPLDELKLETLKEQIEEARKKYNKGIKKEPSAENSIKILDEIKKDEKDNWYALLNNSNKEKFLKSKESGFRRVKDLDRIYDVFKKDKILIKVKEAKKKNHNIKGPNTYSFQIGKLPSRAMSNKKISCVMHILKEQETEYNKDTYFVLPVRVLKLFYQSNSKLTNPHYYIHKDDNNQWYISTKFKDKINYEIKMKLDSYMSKTPTQMKGKKRANKDFVWDDKDKQGKKTLKFIKRISNRK